MSRKLGPMRTLMLALAGVLLLGCTSAPRPAAEEPSPGVQVTVDELERARELVDAAEPFSKAAANPELSEIERRDSRKEAYGRLREARRLYDSWLDAHPGQEESIDSEYTRMASMLFWIRKMAAADELG